MYRIKIIEYENKTLGDEKETLEKMKHCSILINTARGDLVNTKDIQKASYLQMLQRVIDEML